MLFTPHGVFNTLSNHQLKQLGKFPPFCVLDFITLSKKDEILLKWWDSREQEAEEALEGENKNNELLMCSSPSDLSS